MASTFSCQPKTNNEPNKICIFQGVGSCDNRDHVSHLICNAHAAMFGLVNRLVSYHDGENNTWTKIVTYALSTSNINIPLFLDSKNNILMSEINAFAINVCNNYPNFKVNDLASRIACLMGLNMSSIQDICKKSWFDDYDSALIIRNNTGQMQYFKDLPQMHKCLFYFINASNIKNPKSNVESYLISNLSLTRNDSSDTYSFLIPNKQNMLKYNGKPDCAATPLVLDGIRIVSDYIGDRSFRPLAGNSNAIC
ncbi:OrNV vp39-like protein [Tomelloso virus]|uniref:OrNV vp39-like protein n=1 Tax=Tomelloso virus TaxID=2053981 RepID=A0A2H4T2W7_9VIRU|nr:OrNV vp39-like protein [Tomelloso virus]ATY70230.1 OrNV vp39-like protein [Tomelloso virus]